jgi:hypothetical protein
VGECYAPTNKVENVTEGMVVSIPSVV